MKHSDVLSDCRDQWFAWPKQINIVTISLTFTCSMNMLITPQQEIQDQQSVFWKRERVFSALLNVSLWICSRVDTRHGGTGNGKFGGKTRRTVRAPFRSWHGVKIFQNLRPGSEMLVNFTKGTAVFSSREDFFNEKWYVSWWAWRFPWFHN